MKRLVALSALLGTFGLAAACAAPEPPAPDPAALIAAAEALDDQFLTAFNAGDAETLAGLYWNSPDVASFPPDSMFFSGYEAVRGGMSDMVEGMRVAGASLQLNERHHIVVGDAVLSWGLWTMTMTGPDGEPMTISGRFTDAKAERDGRWVYLMDHASVPLPPPDAGGSQ